MITVYRAETLIDAYLVKDYLEQADIPVFIAGEYLTGGIGQLPPRDFLFVQIPDSSFDIAEPLVREVVAMLTQARQDADDADNASDDDWQWAPLPA